MSPSIILRELDSVMKKCTDKTLTDVYSLMKEDVPHLLIQIQSRKRDLKSTIEGKKIENRKDLQTFIQQYYVKVIFY